MEKTDVDQDEVLNEKTYATLNDAKTDQQEVNTKDLEYLNSAKTWKELNIPDNLYEQQIKLGFKSPSRIQALVIKTASKSSNILAQSQNGSGKTLAFMIPAVMSIDRNISTTDENGVCQPQVIILADTTALIQQLTKGCQKLCEGLYPYVVAKIWSKYLDELEGKPHILISTIHQIKNLVAKKAINLQNLKYLVLDECDMVMGNDIAKAFLPQLILKKIPTTSKLILISATLTKVSREIIEKMQEHRTFVESLTPTEQLTLKNVKQYYIQCDKDERYQELDKLLKKISASNILIFANSKNLLQKVHEHLDKQGYKAAMVMSSSVDKAEQTERNQANITGFLQGKFRILIATNLLSRGVDMRKVTLVVNQELPRKFEEGVSNSVIKVDPETYLHRVGRTGRYGDHGIAVNFVCDANQKVMLDDIMGHYKNDIKSLKSSEYEEIESALQGINSYNVKKREHLGEDI